MRTALLLLPLCMLVAGCDGDESIICTTEARFGVNLSVKDATTGQLIPEGVRGALRDGAYLDSLHVFTDIEGRIYSLAGAVERPGTYRVDLVATGYQPWTRSDVRVEDGRCHVTPVSLVAEMVPTGG
ncbi:MAG: carboxypeptidase regulatory-like domain-containing protein [Gemmatimonadetes bacterium]|nr:carboxypeptidase regulatory-like domain-containing protein [Gemmatimonadota bacterium]MBK9547799.1 carboxypeptidase regulatory-like domain-containing protein [Gemmatimonadota bacterium]MBP7621296.1 carboxypeptidase regulatory-like domain-containing protein [Gemmatimonadales bacterium]MBP9896779.1 carboxypeptidase regulatory-like domain-containing protein [Gemmatimonadales bacterium]